MDQQDKKIATTESPTVPTKDIGITKKAKPDKSKKAKKRTPKKAKSANSSSSAAKLAHALQKPVVLVSSNGDDVPFDLKHIRVIYYDVSDPFWGAKLIDKVAENIISAIKNPEEAVFERALDIQ